MVRFAVNLLLFAGLGLRYGNAVVWLAPEALDAAPTQRSVTHAWLDSDDVIDAVTDLNQAVKPDFVAGDSIGVGLGVDAECDEFRTWADTEGYPGDGEQDPLRDIFQWAVQQEIVG